MKPSLVVGVSGHVSLPISAAKTVPALYPGAADFQAMPAVFATGFHVGLLEWAALEALKPHLDAGEGSLGIHIDVSHSAATLPGQTVTAKATVTEIAGRRITFAVEAHDGVDVIGKGKHQRMVVAWDRFVSKVNQKAGTAGVPPLG